MHREKQKKTDDKNVEPASEHDHRLHISVEQPGGCKAERCRKIVKYSHIGQGIARAWNAQGFILGPAEKIAEELAVQIGRDAHSIILGRVNVAGSFPYLIRARQIGDSHDLIGNAVSSIDMGTLIRYTVGRNDDTVYDPQDQEGRRE